LHVSYDENGIDEFYRISLIENASYKEQVLFDARYVGNNINPFISPFGNFINTFPFLATV